MYPRIMSFVGKIIAFSTADTSNCGCRTQVIQVTPLPPRARQVCHQRAALVSISDGQLLKSHPEFSGERICEDPALAAPRSTGSCGYHLGDRPAALPVVSLR